MILEIAADARQGGADGDAVRAKIRGIADPRQHEKLGGVDDAAREQNFPRRPHMAARAPDDVVEPHRPAALEDDPGRGRVRAHREVGPAQGRAQIGGRRAAAPAVADGHLQAAETALLGRVVILGPAMAGRKPRRREGVHERIVVAAGLDAERAGAAAVQAVAALPCFGSLEIGQQRLVRPPLEAGRGPAGVVAAIAAHIGHGVGRRGSADHFAAGAFDPAAADILLRFTEIAPIEQALLEDDAPSERHMNPGAAVPAAGFQEQHAHGRIGREPVRQDAAGRSGADDHVVEAFLILHPNFAPRPLRQPGEAVDKQGDGNGTECNRYCQPGKASLSESGEVHAASRSKEVRACSRAPTPTSTR